MRQAAAVEAADARRSGDGQEEIVRILVVDPGKMTGYCWLSSSHAYGATSDVEVVAGGELAHFDFLDYAMRAFNEFSTPPQRIVCESFTVTQRSAKVIGNDRIYSVEQIGVLRMMCFLRGVEYIEQSPSDAKNFCTDEKLRKLNLYKGRPGEAGHRRDACRHAVLYAIRNNLIDPRELL